MLNLIDVHVYGIYSECIPICCIRWTRSYNNGYNAGYRQEYNRAYNDGYEYALLSLDYGRGSASSHD